MITLHWFRKMENERDDYALREGFVRVFEYERASMQRLALLLTANLDAVELCLSRAFQECVSSSSVSREWVLSWTRRVIIRNAINLVTNPESDSPVKSTDDADSRAIASSQDAALVAAAGSDSILNLPTLDRFVYVICILERCSVYDCALLLGRSPSRRKRSAPTVGDVPGWIRELTDSAPRVANE